MNVLVHHSYRASRKEQLAVMLRRILASFADAGLVPTVDATFADSGDETRVSAVDRAVKKYPELAGFVTTASSFPGTPATRRLGGDAASARLPLDAVIALAEGVPRSLPFDSIHVGFGHPDFDCADASEYLTGGVIVGDSWWVNGRDRSLSAIYTVGADADSSDIQPLPDGAASVVASLGKPRKSSTSVIPEADGVGLAETARAARDLVSQYRASMEQVMERAAPPYELSPLADVLQTTRPKTGPLKPALADAFGPRGFDCRGEPGRFVLRRRTEKGNFETLDVDVGTWSRMVTAQYMVHSAAGTVRLHVPVGAKLQGALQYPIGDSSNWEQIVANIVAVVDELGRSFLPQIEGVFGGSPEWFEPVDPLV